MKINTIKVNNRKELARSKQAGLSMIELLISSVIGVFLIAGVITNFVGTKDSERVRAAMSEMDANARVAMDILRQTVSHASYSSISDLGGAKESFYSASSDPLADTQCRDNVADTLFKGNVKGIQDKPTEDGKLGGSDQMTIVHKADNPCEAGGVAECEAGGANAAKINAEKGNKLVYYDCLGGGADKKSLSVSCSSDPISGMYDNSKAKIYSAFFLKKGKKKKQTYTNLACFGSRSGESQDLVENVENMQILYGVTDTAGTRYLNATDVQTADLWSAVSRVQIALLIRSSIKNVIKKQTKNLNKTDTLSSDNNYFTYKLLDQDITINNKDKRLYRVYSTTILLANSTVETRPIR